jgi:hypothetical protein
MKIVVAQRELLRVDSAGRRGQIAEKRSEKR